MIAPATQLRVLIVRLGSMGDILHALPAVTALRQRHPEWYLGWLVEPQWQSLLAACDAPARLASGDRPTMPLIDRLHLVPTKQWARAPLSGDTVSELLSVRRELRAAQYDVCVDLQGAIRSAALGRMASPARMIGEAMPREAIARKLFNERVETYSEHVIQQAAEIAGQIAHETLPTPLPSLPHSPQAEAWCDRTIARGKPLVLLNPGAGWGAKRWPAERYGAVAAGLNAMGYKVVINTGPGEELIGRETLAASGGGRDRAEHDTGSTDRGYPPRSAGDCRRYGSAASGMRARHPGSRHLRAHRSGAQRALWRSVARTAAS